MAKFGVATVNMSRSHSSENSKLAPTSSSCCKRTNPSSNQDESGGRDKSNQTKHKSFASRYHLNTIWSLWYCVITTFFTSYLVYIGIRRFIVYASLPWPSGEEPFMELNAHVGLVGAAVVVMPFFIVASVVKVGNLPNDGAKLGSTLSTCTRDPPPILQPSSGVIRNLWLHGVPTGPFLHLIAAFCLLLPQTLMGATLIRANFLLQDEIWRTDLDVFFPVGSNLSPPPFNHSDTSTMAPTSDDMLMVRIHGTAGTPFYTASDPIQHRSSGKHFPPASPPPWRVKRKVKRSFGETYPQGELVAAYFPGPLSFPLKTKRKKGDESTLYVFSPHQGREPPAALGFPKRTDFPQAHPTVPTKGAPTQHPARFSPQLKDFLTWKPFSPELLNYGLALLIFAIRYPSVFWLTNKTFSFLFSFHLILTGIQTLVTVESFSVLYKYQVSSAGNSPYEDKFLSHPLSSLLLFILAVMTLTVSSSAVYFYGYQRFASFLDRSRKRFHITYAHTPLVMRPHAAPLGALAVLLCLSLSLGPLLWDLCTLYRRTEGHMVLLTAIAATISYIILWVFLWIFLSCKSSWVFKLRVTVARAFVSSARSIKLVNDVEMSRANTDGALSPILVVGNGRALAIKDDAPKKAIMGVVNKIKEEKKARGQEEDIYWLRPNFNSSFDRGKLGGKPQPKVTFNDLVEEKYSSGKKCLKERPFSETDEEEDEAGDYAILKESFPAYITDDSERTLSSGESERSQTSPIPKDPRYVDRNQILAYHRDASKGSSSTDSSPVLVAPDYEDTEQLEDADQFEDTFHGRPTRHQVFLESQGSMTPRSTRSNDSGMPVETPSQRSDSLSSSSSNSNTPPENSEESGVHSGALDNSKNKSNSDEDLSQLPNDLHQPLIQRGSIVGRRHGMTKLTSGRPTSAETTVAIRRQRHMTQEIRPPDDPIYGTRKITSFAPTEGSNSPIPSPVPPMPPLPSPVPPMPPLPSLEETGVVGLFPPRHTSIGAHTRVNLQQENPYIQRSSQGQLKYPQIPLPPIPQGMIPPSSMEPFRNTSSGIYGRTTGPRQQVLSSVGGNDVYGYTRNVPMGRSSSLRYPSTQVGIPKQYTNTLPHVLPKDSHYNTNV